MITFLHAFIDQIMKLYTLLFQLLLLLVSAAISSAASENDRYDLLLIDNGASQPTSFNDSDFYTYQWLTDDKFTDAGENFVFTSSPNLSFPMNSLRFFPSGRRSSSCYDLPCYVFREQKFLFRLGFLYGNYDGLSRPPRFDLTIDGNFWTTVETSMSDEPVYYEVIYRTKKPGAKVCLVSEEEDASNVIPFVSSIEVFHMPWDEGMYSLMDNHTALFLHTRNNFGANKTIEKNIGHYEESYGRIWKSSDKTVYSNIQANRIPSNHLDKENLPPWPVLATAIQAKSNSSSIDLQVNFSSSGSPNTDHDNNFTAYFVLYFKDPISRIPNTTSIVDIYINQNMVITSLHIPSWTGNDDYRVVSLLHPIMANRSAIITISPANGSEVAPFLNAMEVFSVLKVSKAYIHLVAPTLVLLNLLLLIVLCVEM